MLFLDVRIDVAFMTGIYWRDSKLVRNNHASCGLEISLKPGVANRTKPNQKPIEPNRSIGVRLDRQSNIIELELFCEFD